MRTQLLSALMSALMASAAQAEVIEISDDGEARLVGSGVSAPVIPGDPIAEAGRAGSDDPFEVAARRHGLDVKLLRAVAWTESRGRNDAVSPKGARGIMQLMPATAASLGVDPADPIANINGGAAYLARQLTTFRDVPLALAAYNAGPGAVMRYRGVPPYAETRDYVAKIMRRWSPLPSVAAARALPGPQLLPATDVVRIEHAEAVSLNAVEPVFMIEVPTL